MNLSETNELSYQLQLVIHYRFINKKRPNIQCKFLLKQNIKSKIFLIACEKKRDLTYQKEIETGSYASPGNFSPVMICY
jgi:hypothetical protein